MPQFGWPCTIEQTSSKHQANIMQAWWNRVQM